MTAGLDALGFDAPGLDSPDLDSLGLDAPGRDAADRGVPGLDLPDRRGRTGLDRYGRDLTGNPRVRIRAVDVLSCDWYVLRRTTFDYRHGDGHWSREQRETYDRGDGATILLHNAERGTVLMTRQFRLPAYVNGHPDGMLIETAAGLLDGDSPEEAIRREAAEETGCTVGEPEHVFDVYMSPGSVTERLHFFAAPYDTAPAAGGHGVVAEGEDITAVELPFAEALAMIGSGAVADAKTIMLLQWAALNGPFRPDHG
ncbi:NUDIX domain-containing protein [Kitasatospora nipponensis]|uniref:NUDIX domain-containing protein n=1 Tax=Kitasatospora nipponensis TaxID=258049 RepID=A0ABP4HMU2_9ACTN